jgi:Protein kinase domain
VASGIPRPVMPDVGSVVAGYRLDALLGHRGMGVVYSAQHLTLERPAAVKIIQPQMADSPEFRDRFRRESRTAASLEHPNIVPIFDAGEADGVLYIAMRLIAGQDLAARIAEQGPLPAPVAVQITAQVAAALDAAHAAGLVHHDLTPDRVLLPDDVSNHAYLTGLGVKTDSATMRVRMEAGRTLGGVDFTAPEQLRGETADRRADVYSLGAILYQSLTGRVPFPRDNELATMWAHINDEPPTVTELVPELPAQLDAIIARALAKNPDDRPATAGELAALARAAIEGRVVDLGKVAADTDPGLRAPTSARAPRPSRAWMLPACGIVAVVVYVIGQLLRPPDEPDANATIQAVKAWAQAHQTGLVVRSAVLLVGATAALGLIAAVSRVIRDANGRHSSRGLATLAVGVSFVVLVVTDQAFLIALAHESGSHDLSLIKFIWYADGYLEPAISSLVGFFVAGVAAEARRNGTLSNGVTSSGLAIGLFAGTANLVFLVLPVTGDSVTNGLLTLVFVIMFGWALVFSVILTARARALGSIPDGARP